MWRSEFSSDLLAELAHKPAFWKSSSATVARFHETWSAEKNHLPLSRDLIATIEKHVKT